MGNRHLRALLLLILSGTLLCAAPARAAAHGANGLLHEVNVFAEDPSLLKDPRRPQTQSGEGKVYAPIGLINTDVPVPQQGPGDDTEMTQATAFLVSPCYIMTNFHAVFGDFRRTVTDADVRRYTATFILGDMRTHAHVAAAGEYNLDNNRDYAFLKLDTCFGANLGVGWLPLGALAADADQTDVSLAGYPGDKDLSLLWIQENCHLFGRRAVSFARLTDCADTRGSSGSPVLVRRDGLVSVVGIVRSERNRSSRVLPRYDERYANVAVDMFRILRNDLPILRLIVADVESFYRDIIPESERMTPEQLAQCGGGDLEIPVLQDCMEGLRLLSAQAATARGRQRLLSDDELQRVWIPARH
jgi:V8-like Glu-specific endopeptidase